jgi:hypothetical protein
MMTDQSASRIDEQQLRSKELHDLMLAMPPRDGFCRFYGSYVPVGSEACFPDGMAYRCVETETFQPTGESC